MSVISQPKRGSTKISLDKMSEVFDFKMIKRLHFLDPRIGEKVRVRCLKKLKKEEYAKQNKWTTHLFGKEVEEKRVVPVEIRYIDPLIGYGVYSIEDIAPLTYVGSYLGLVRKRSRRQDKDNNYVFRYVIGPHDTPWVIDARHHGNFTRFINHSYEPNLTSKWMIHNQRALSLIHI